MCSAPVSLFSDSDPKSQRFNTLAQWLDWQEGLHYTAIDLGLDRCRKVADRMNLLKPDFSVISIAGTNGKGSSATMLEMMFCQSDYKVGCYTSPHLIKYNERIRINGCPASDAMLCESFNRVDQARGDISLTYFEFGTLAALDIFHRLGIELAVMEVGLGGRLDAVNILDADISLLTTVHMDHENWLGHSREAIGREKAGIFRPMRPAICSDTQPPDSVSVSAETIGATLYVSGRDFSYAEDGENWNWSYAGSELRGLPRPSMSNENQLQNAAGVLMVLHFIREDFPVSEDVIRSCLRDFRLPGRFQLIPGEIPVILDVAHNQQASAALAASLDKLPLKGKTHLVLGMLKDKNHSAVLAALMDVVDYWYLAGLAGERGADADELAAALSSQSDGNKCRSQGYNNVSGALQAARTAARPGDRIVITGSFITVADASRQLQL